MATHRIARQVVEIAAGDAGLARALADRASLASPALAATLARRFDAFDDGRRRRLDRVVLDLGRCDPADWEASLLVNLEAALARTLPVALAGAESPAPVEAALDLLAAFARDGAPPWWADPGPAALAEAASTIAADAAPETGAALRFALAAPGATLRLSRQLPAPALAALTARLTGLAPADLATAAGQLATAAAAARLAPDPPLPAVWRALLDAAVDIEAGTPAAAVWRAAVDRLAALARADPAAARAALRTAGVMVSSKPLADALHDGAAPSGRVDTRARERQFVPAREEGPAQQGGEAIKPRQTPPGVTPPHDPASRSTAAPRPTDPPPLGAVPLPATGEPSATPESRSPAHAPAQPVAPDPPTVARDDRADPAPIAPAARREPPYVTATPPPRSPPPRPRPSPSPSEPLAIPTAGIVLLWPFLPDFFATAGLLDADRAFRSGAARHRAATLLDHIATGDDEAPEARLPLAKLLAGLPVDAIHDPGPPLDDRELGEARALLEAVLGHAPMLGRLSVDGLRGSYLLRDGLLAIVHGGWRLTVERRGWDVLLDRLPWRFGWVRLPWMPEPLQVDW